MGVEARLLEHLVRRDRPGSDAVLEWVVYGPLPFMCGIDVVLYEHHRLPGIGRDWFDS